MTFVYCDAARPGSTGLCDSFRPRSCRRV